MGEVLLPDADTMSDEPAPAPPAAREADPAMRLRRIVEDSFDFIWRSLRGLGIPAESADDAAQRVFYIFSQKQDEIAVGSERAFLFGTALRVAANARRTQARRREVYDEEALRRMTDPAPDGERVVELKERRALLDQVLGEMSDDLRTVFVLFVLEGMATPEIAELLDLPPGTVASRLRRAREAFHTISKRLQARLTSGRSR
jgi:RNA polymerase sigma-70 factor (ECF subfamily)